MSLNIQERIVACLKLRKDLSEAFALLLSNTTGLNEISFCEKLHNQFFQNESIYSHGWYEPPPLGMAALFGEEKDNFKRLQFDTLRKEEFWPKKEFVVTANTAALLYASPVDKQSGIIGDFGLTVYTGENIEVQQHLQACLSVVEKTAEYAQVSMELREVHNYSQKLLKSQGLTNNRTVTYTDKVGTNIGHTIPWSYEDPSSQESDLIQSGNFEQVKNLISKKRVNLNKEEKFKIPTNIAFTTEIRIESLSNPSLPNTFFHIIVAFVNGHKTINGNFKPTFEALNTDRFIKTAY